MKVLGVLLVGLVGLFVWMKISFSLEDRQVRASHPCLAGRLISDPGASAPASTEGMRALNAAVRAQMHDRGSFRPILTQIHPEGRSVAGYTPAQNNSIAAVRFDGTNLFGATVTTTVVAEINPRLCSVVRLFD